MAASSFASPLGFLLLHVTTSIVCCFCFHFFDLKEENLSAVGGAKAKQFNYNPLKRIEFFCERKKTFSSFEIKKVD